MTAIEFNNISKVYDGKTTLNNVSGIIEKGTVSCLIGRNGSGKTTLLEILFGLRKPDTGTVKIAGIDPHLEPEVARQKVAFVSEACHIYPWMKTSDLEGFLKPLYKNWSSEIFKTQLERFAIQTDKKVRNMSKGNKHKLMLASAVATQPEVLILDEPLSGFDPVIRDEVLETLIENLCESGVTIIISSHQIDDIEKISEHALILIDGEFKINAKVDEIDESVKKVIVNLEEAIGSTPTDEDILHSMVAGKQLELIVQNYSEENVKRLLSGLKVIKSRVEHISLKDLLVGLTKGVKSVNLDK